MATHPTFWSRVDKMGSVPKFAAHLGRCWIWMGPIDRKGYGRSGGGRGVSILAHRLAYEEIVGPIPVGLTIDHLCRNKPCVNPSHMEPVTAGENSRRGLALITHCPHGHEYTKSNTCFQPKAAGYRQRACRACKAAWSARPVICECGAAVVAGALARHRRSAVHAAAVA